jgi:hypothetical protein
MAVRVILILVGIVVGVTVGWRWQEVERRASTLSTIASLGGMVQQGLYV